jgi:prepilin-type N-terminal cleavage/methylation domain-containing protein
MNTRGVTMVELLVVLVLLGLMAGVVGLAWRPSPTRAAESPLIAARQRAIQSGIPTPVQLSDTLTVIAMPDGSVIGAGALSIDPLTGAPAPAPAPEPARDGAR